ITFRGSESARTIGLRLCGTRKRSPIKVVGKTLTPWRRLEDHLDEDTKGKAGRNCQTQNQHERSGNPYEKVSWTNDDNELTACANTAAWDRAVPGPMIMYLRVSSQTPTTSTAP
ncbi:hypothetical protein ALC62_00615, partial [Cyphomyrmex costatus]